MLCHAPNKMEAGGEPVIAEQLFLQQAVRIERLDKLNVKALFAQEANEVALAKSVLEERQVWTFRLVEKEVLLETTQRAIVRNGDQNSAARLQHAKCFGQKRFGSLNAMLDHAN